MCIFGAHEYATHIAAKTMILMEYREVYLGNHNRVLMNLYFHGRLNVLNESKKQECDAILPNTPKPKPNLGRYAIIMIT